MARRLTASVGRPGRGEAKPRANVQDQEVLLPLGGRLSTCGSLTQRGTVLRHRVRAPHRAEGFPPRPGQAPRLPRSGRAGAAGSAPPGAWVASPCRVRGWRALACRARIGVAACAWARQRSLVSHRPPQAGRVALDPGRGWSAARASRDRRPGTGVWRVPGGTQRRGGGRPRQPRRCLALRGTKAGGSGEERGSQDVGAWSGGRAWGEAGGTSRRTPVPQPAPNKGLQLTASSLRSCLAPASGSS